MANLISLQAGAKSEKTGLAKTSQNKLDSGR